jgi:spore coat protein CotH
MKKFFFLIILIYSFNILNAQIFNPDLSPVYEDNIVPKIYITIHPDSLAAIFSNVDSEIEYRSTFIYNSPILNDTLNNVGFSLRGNTSLQAAKKSFSLSFNSFNSGRDFHGIEKMNLNGEHNDPSIIRSKLCWDLFRNFNLPSARANHVEVYINGNYYGLYINVEHIDEKFLKKRFANNNGNLYKCLYPADLAYLGSDPNLYKLASNGKRIYELKTNETLDNYNDLANFIRVINKVATADLHLHLDSVFNTNSFIKTLCIDVLAGNWDGYAYNKNNFYLYHNTANGKFEYIPYDLDNTFGIDWFNINWTTRNIYSWYKTSESRPLVSKILQNPEYRKRFTFYMKQLMATHFNTTTFFSRIDQVKSMIQASAFGDSYRTLDYNWTIADFINSYTTALGAHVKQGLKPYITARISSASTQLENTNTKPIIYELFNQNLRINQDIIVNAKVEDETINPTVTINYKINSGNNISAQLYDDGLHNDKLAGDKIYGFLIPSLSSTAIIYYNIQATDSNAQTSTEPISGNYQIRILPLSPQLYINEFMASNSTGFMDNFGEFDDWIEIVNKGNTDVYLGDKYLSDNYSTPAKWKMPDIFIHPNEFLVFFADNSAVQGNMHSNFKLDASKEEIGIFDSDSNYNLPIDTISYTNQFSDISYGRFPDGSPNWFLMNNPTPSLSNIYTGVNRLYFAQHIAIYPNPASQFINIHTNNNEISISKILIYNIFGQKVEDIDNINDKSYQYTIDKNKLIRGMYIVKVELSGKYAKREICSKIIIN